MQAQPRNACTTAAGRREGKHSQKVKSPEKNRQGKIIEAKLP